MSAYIAHETRGIARSLGLKPINTPVCSPQSNGMAESFVNTFKRDYMSRMDLRDAPTVLAQLPGAFEPPAFEFEDDFAQGVPTTAESPRPSGLA